MSHFRYSSRKRGKDSFPHGLPEVLLIEGPQADLFAPANWPVLARVLRDYVRERRWFRGKARAIRSSRVVEAVPIPGPDPLSVVLLRLHYREGEEEVYVLPLMLLPPEEGERIGKEYPFAPVAVLKDKGGGGVFLCDALAEKSFGQLLLQAIAQGKDFPGKNGRIAAAPTGAFRDLRGPDALPLEPFPVKAEQSNTSVIYGDRLILKIYRRLEEGLNPDVEITRFLTERGGFAHFAPVAGTLVYRGLRRGEMSLGVLQKFIPNQGDAWEYTLKSLVKFLRSVSARPDLRPEPVPRTSPLGLLGLIPACAGEMIGEYFPSAETLGRRTAELHLALADPEHPDFAPEPFTLEYQVSLCESMRAFAAASFRLLQEQRDRIPEEGKDLALKVLDLKDAVIGRYERIRHKAIPAVRMRCHGDYHLGQVLYTGKDFVIIDFEGEPARPLSERRLKRSPIQDVGGMIRSFHYAARSAFLSMRSSDRSGEEERSNLKAWTQYWYTWVSTVFLKAYVDKMSRSLLIPESAEELGVLLEAYLLDKAIYEAAYELNNRPSWVQVPLQGILQLMEAD